MRHIRTIHIGLLAAVSLAGCAAAPSKVAAVGTDAFHLSVVGNPAMSQADLNYSALLAATQYCAQSGQQVLFRQSQESGEHPWSAKREDLTFVCMRANDPAYLHAGLKRDTPVTVVAQQ